MGFWTLSCKRKKRSRKVVKRRVSKKKKSPISKRKSRKGSKKKTRRKVSKKKKTRRKVSKKKKTRRKSRFGRAVSLNQMMGNVNPMEMNTFTSYTGMGPKQMTNHLDGIPSDLRSNFYV